MKNQPLWLDVSKWQGDINYTALSQADETVYGIFSRAGWGADGGYIDPQFARNWSKSKQFGYYRSSYWAYWDYYPMLHQLDLWFKANPTIDLIPRMWDLEVEDAHPEFLSEQTWLASEEVNDRDGKRFIIYSRVDILERTLCKYWTPEQLNMHYYLLAQFDVGDGEEYNGIVVPDFVEPKNILWKQTSDKIPMFTSSGPMDRDRWIWTDVATMHEQIQEMWGDKTPGPDPELPECCEKLQIYVENVDKATSINVSAIDVLNTKSDVLRKDLDSTKTTANNNHTDTNNTRLELRALEDKVSELTLANEKLEAGMGILSENVGTVEKSFRDLQRTFNELEEQTDGNLTKVWIKLDAHSIRISALALRLSIIEWIKRLFGDKE